MASVFPFLSRLLPAILLATSLVLPFSYSFAKEAQGKLHINILLSAKKGNQSIFISGDIYRIKGVYYYRGPLFPSGKVVRASGRCESFTKEGSKMKNCVTIKGNDRNVSVRVDQKSTVTRTNCKVTLGNTTVNLCEGGIPSSMKKGSAYWSKASFNISLPNSIPSHARNMTHGAKCRLKLLSSSYGDTSGDGVSGLRMQRGAMCHVAYE